MWIIIVACAIGSFLLAMWLFEKKLIVSIAMMQRLLKTQPLKLLERKKDFKSDGHIEAKLQLGKLEIEYELSGFDHLVTQTVRVTSKDAIGSFDFTFMDNNFMNYHQENPKFTLLSRESERLQEFYEPCLLLLNKIREVAGPP